MGKEFMSEIKKKNSVKDNSELACDIDIKLKSSNNNVDLGKMFTYTIAITNKSKHDLLDVNITQRIDQELKICDATIDSINIKNVNRYNKVVIFYIDKIKEGETKLIEVIVELTNADNKKYIKSQAKLEATYLDESKSNIILYSNKCNVDVLTPKLLLTKKALVSEAIVGETVKFKILVQNKGNIDINNVIIRDILKPELKFLNNTIKVDNINVSNESILSGINLGVLKKDDIKEIEFDAKILSKPDSGIITNVSIGQYEYNLAGEDKIREGNAISNENRINIQLASLKINKVADKKEVSLGEEINYEIEIENDGTLEIKSIILNEKISDLLIIEDGGFAINGQIVNNINLSEGILIGNLNIGEKVTITYKAKYIKSNNHSKIINVTKVNFNYKQTSGLIFKGNEIEKILDIDSTISTFKYVCRSEKVYKGDNKPYIGEVYKVTSEINILEYHIVETIKGQSNEGQNLTGYKIVLQGIIKEIIEYSSCDCKKLLYTITEHIPFSEFIVLPLDFKLGSKISIDYKIEDISFRKRDIESVYTNVCLLLIAKIQPYISNLS